MKVRRHNLIFLIVVIAIVGFCIINQLVVNKDLIDNGIILQGKIISTGYSSKSSIMNFDYEFYYDGKILNNSSSAGVINPKEFIGKYFPVRFSPKSGRSEILIFPRHFKRYEIDYQDSLLWVKQYVINGI